jgi:PAS domain S-box-containing protein
MMDARLEEMSRQELIRELKKRLIADSRAAELGDDPDRDRLIHDLHVHQVELEMQNRELHETQQRLEECALRYADLYDSAPVGYCTLTPDGVIRDINLTGAALLGRPRDQLLGTSFPSVSPLEDRRPFDAHLDRLKAGQPRVATELQFRSGRGAYAVHLISVPVAEAPGGTKVFRTLLMDISERRQLEDKLRMLSEAGEALSSSLDYGDTLKTVARFVVPALADLCLVDLRRDDGETERPVVAFADAAKQERLGEVLRRFRPHPGRQTAQAAVITSGEPMLLPEVPASDLDVAHHADIPPAAGIRSLLVVPLSARGRTFGALTLAAAESDRRYSSVDLRLAEDLANRAAMAIDNARLYAEAQSAIRDLRAVQDQLRELNQTLEERVCERTKWLMLVHDVTRGINEASRWDEALRAVLNRICEAGQWQVGFVYLPVGDAPHTLKAAISRFTDERFRAFHAASEQQHHLRGQSIPGRVFADGTPVWVNGQEALLRLLAFRRDAARDAGLIATAALPIRFGRDVVAVLELFSDEPHEPNELLVNLMNDVSAQIGEVLERERTTSQMADLVWREQQELLHTLHDSLGQTLTGLGMLSAGLHQQLSGAHPAAAHTAEQIAGQAQVALEEVRQISRGLFPVEIDAESLLPALRDLAATTEALHRIRVYAEGDARSAIRDSRVATQVYRIAQEAVTNAVKHARAHTINIQIAATSGLTTLRIADDGVGMRPGSQGDGLGLRIMRYRAASIGGVLSIDSGRSGGTTVTCTLRETPHAISPGSGS